MTEPVVEPLNPLSVPRGVRLVDELTGEPAKYVCTIGGSQYYYSALENQKLDYDGILFKIAPLMDELASATRRVGTSVERAAHGKRTRTIQTEIISNCDVVANDSLAQKRFELAVPAALRGLRTLVSVYGEGASELIPSYLVLAEANLGLGRIAQAEGFLSTANFILVKHPTANNVLRSRMHRNFGRVHAAQGNNPAALESFARDIFFCTLAVGPEHISTSIGYFFLAQVFAAQVQMEAALAFFDKVVDIWYKHLLGAKSAIATALGLDFEVKAPQELLCAAGKPIALPEVSLELDGAATQAQVDHAPEAAPINARHVSATQIAEALEMLEFIRKVRETHLGKEHIATGEVLYTESLVALEAGKAHEALSLLENAATIFNTSLGSEHATTIDATELLARLRTQLGITV